jgi:hypothetical protein
MKFTKLTSSEVRDTMPTSCLIIEESGCEVLGGIQIQYEDGDDWPSREDLELAASARFGKSTIADVEPDDDGEAVTWAVIRA